LRGLSSLCGLKPQHRPI